MTKYVLAAITTLLFTLPAMAQLEDVTCTAPDCLTGGYQLSNENGLFEFGQCVLGDCENLGWQIQDALGRTRDVQCAANGCYSEGYQEYDLATGDLLKTRTCKDGGTGVTDCLTHGWTDQFADNTTEEAVASNGVSVQDGFILQIVEDNTATLEAELEALKTERRTKKQDLKAYLKSLSFKEKIENRLTIKSKVKEIVALSRQIRAKKKELRNGGGPVVVSSRTATCKDASGNLVDSSQNPGSCFINGYIAQ